MAITTLKVKKIRASEETIGDSYMGKRGKIQHIRCPMCRETIEIPRDTERDDVVTCFECDGEYRVVSLKPVRLRSLDEDEWERDMEED